MLFIYFINCFTQLIYSVDPLPHLRVDVDHKHARARARTHAHIYILMYYVKQNVI